VPLNKLWLALKPLLLRSDLSSEAVLVAKQAVAQRDPDELVDTGEFILELIALQEDQGGGESQVDVEPWSSQHASRVQGTNSEIIAHGVTMLRSVLDQELLPSL